MDLSLRKIDVAVGFLEKKPTGIKPLILCIMTGEDVSDFYSPMTVVGWGIKGEYDDTYRGRDNFSAPHARRAGNFLVNFKHPDAFSNYSLFTKNVFDSQNQIMQPLPLDCSPFSGESGGGGALIHQNEIIDLAIRAYTDLSKVSYNGECPMYWAIHSSVLQNIIIKIDQNIEHFFPLRLSLFRFFVKKILKLPDFSVRSGTEFLAITPKICDFIKNAIEEHYTTSEASGTHGLAP